MKVVVQVAVGIVVLFELYIIYDYMELTISYTNMNSIISIEHHQYSTCNQIWRIVVTGFTSQTNEEKDSKDEINK